MVVKLFNIYVDDPDRYCVPYTYNKKGLTNVDYICLGKGFPKAHIGSGYDNYNNWDDDDINNSRENIIKVIELLFESDIKW